MDLDQIWSKLQSSRTFKDLTPLISPLIITNSSTQKQYKVTHRYTDSKNAFIGYDNSECKYHIKVFVISSLNHFKIISKRFRLINEHSENIKSIKIVDIIRFFNSERWFMVLITPYLEGFTIDELSEGCHDSNYHLPKEVSIKIYLEILDIIKVSKKNGLKINTLPDNIFLSRNKDSQFLFDLKILPTSLHLLNCGKSKLEKIYPKDLKNNNSDGNIWGAGLCLYALTSDSKLQSLPLITDLEDQSRQALLQTYYNDEALSYILKHSLDSTTLANFCTQSILVYWRELLNQNWEAIERFSINHSCAFLSGLTFESLNYRLYSVKLILIIASSYAEKISTVLTNSDLIYTFVENCLHFDWNTNPELINSLILILKEKISSRTFKEKLISMNFLLIFKQALKLHSRQELIFNFIEVFFENNTLTILQIIKDEQFLQKILEKPVKTSQELDFIKGTMSFYGPYSVELIKIVYETTNLSENLTLKYLQDIPYIFKQENCQLLISLIEKILEKSAKIKGDLILNILMTTVIILAEILVIPKLIQYDNVLGICTNQSENQSLTKLIRNQLLMKCSTCGLVLCSICNQHHPPDHETKYILYQYPAIHCSNTNSNQIFSDILQFQTPKDLKVIFIDSNEITYNGLTVRFIGPAGSRLTTLEPIKIEGVDQSSTIIYFEVKVNSAGLQENIELGLEGTGVALRSVDGGIYKHGTLIGRVPRFASFDVVGLGVTGNSKVYITYHGLVSWPMIECELKSEIRPFVVLGCDNCDIEVQMTNFVFKPSNQINSTQEVLNSSVMTISNKVLVTTVNLVKKAFRNNKNSPKSKDLLEKFSELLRIIGRYDLLEKVTSNKSRFWPF